MIDCNNHGKTDGYIVCVHVLTGAPVAHFFEATHTGDDAQDLGEVLCAACHAIPKDAPKHPMENYKVICASCAHNRLGLPTVRSAWE